LDLPEHGLADVGARLLEDGVQQFGGLLFGLTSYRPSPLTQA
jgi:hypothetical protein